MSMNANSIAPFAISEAQQKSRSLQVFGESIATGENKSVGVMEAYVGGALRDTCEISNATLKCTMHACNMMEIGQNRIEQSSVAMQRALGLIGTSGANSHQHLPRLQEQLDEARKQVNLMVRSADFDNIGLFSGEAKNLEIPVGTSITDSVKVSLPDLLNGKLFRSSITTSINKWLAADHTRTTYYANAGQLEQDKTANVNLVACALAGAGGSGAGGAMSNNQLADALLALTPNEKALLDKIAPIARAALTTANAGVTFVNADQAQMRAMTAGGANKNEITALLQDNMPTNISTGADQATLTKNRVIAEDVLLNASNTLRDVKAIIVGKKDHILSAAQSLRTTVNVTQKSADSYLNTDYLKTVQDFAETLQALMAAISSIQGSNKQVDATQRFMSSTLER